MGLEEGMKGLGVGSLPRPDRLAAEGYRSLSGMLTAMAKRSDRPWGRAIEVGVLAALSACAVEGSVAGQSHLVFSGPGTGAGGHSYGIINTVKNWYDITIDGHRFFGNVTFSKPDAQGERESVIEPSEGNPLSCRLRLHRDGSGDGDCWLPNGDRYDVQFGQVGYLALGRSTPGASFPSAEA